MEINKTHLLALLVVAAGSPLSSSCSDGASGFPEVGGWTQSGEVRIYTADNLWEYIDGAAMLFVDYGVRTCTTADLTGGGVSATVDLYEMPSPLHAVGVFRRESPGSEVTLPGVTMASFSPPYQALMVKGDTYAKVNAFEGELTEVQGRRLLEGLAASLPGEAVMPPELSLLPERGRLPGSEGYQPGAMLGLEELSECLYAEYRGGEGETWQGFVVLPAAAPSVWEALGDRWESLEYEGLTIRYRAVPYSGLVGIARTDSGMFGVSGAADETQLLARLGALAGLR